MKRKILGCIGILACSLLMIASAKALTVTILDITYSLNAASSVISEARTMDLNYQKITNTPTYVRTDTEGSYLDVVARKRSALGIYEAQLTYRFYDPVENVTDSESYYKLVPGVYKYQLASYSVYMKGTVKVYNSDSANS